MAVDNTTFLISTDEARINADPSVVALAVWTEGARPTVAARPTAAADGVVILFLMT